MVYYTLRAPSVRLDARIVIVIKYFPMREFRWYNDLLPRNKPRDDMLMMIASWCAISFVFGQWPKTRYLCAKAPLIGLDRHDSLRRYYLHELKALLMLNVGMLRLFVVYNRRVLYSFRMTALKHRRPRTPFCLFFSNLEARPFQKFIKDTVLCIFIKMDIVRCKKRNVETYRIQFNNI